MDRGISVDDEGSLESKAPIKPKLAMPIIAPIPNISSVIDKRLAVTMFVPLSSHQIESKRAVWLAYFPYYLPY